MDQGPDRARSLLDRLRTSMSFSAAEIVVLSVLAALVVGGASLAWIRSRPVPIALGASAEPAASSSPTPESAVPIWVHVVGAVRSPGVYRLEAGARGVDAVRAAGGLARRAEPGAVNLARPLADGEQLVVPRSARDSASNTSGGATGSSSQDLVNINTADSAELETLPGIGPALAERIVAHRAQHGPFGSVRDLLDVSGIGEKTLADIEPFVTV